MESKKLLEAVQNGDVSALLDLLEQDPLVLDKIIVLGVSETPLHVASVLGHAELVRELLTRSPGLASELDSRGNSPLHLAAAKGHGEIVGLLLSADRAAASVRNLDGRAPIHVAAIKGRDDAVGRIIGAGGAKSARELTDRGETALHLAVANGKMEVVRLVVGAVGGRDRDELLNRKDCDGNCILHIAVAKKQTETIKFLLAIPGANVNPINKNGSTPLDVLKQSPRDLQDMEIEDSLLNKGALRSKSIYPFDHDHDPDPDQPQVPQLWREAPTSPLLVLSKTPSRNKPPARKKENEISRHRSSLMVVASLIATVAFQAAITPPGGVWQNDLTVDENGLPVKDPHYAGTSIMAHNQRAEYGLFFIFNTMAFLSSLSIILLLVSGLPIKRRRWMWVQMVTMWIAMTAQVITYFIALRHMSLDKTEADVYPVLKDVTEIAVLAWFCLMGLVFVANLARVSLYYLRKKGYIKKKKKREDEARALSDDAGEDELV
ncbi:ankyrin repeat-containing protein NPR4-like [Rhodamnia argentea]|uniref:Ankyrin repeat-containing protein NPR4-like n=1 Tax=Rhodamnia argentea TaxID=178133 RepID=A0A8B8P807_9MYRT|nr:ankyrin repeat-containing protein NPR4-like [Rhodamnia argentea]